MKPRLSVLTLGVADLESSLKVCRDGLGLPIAGLVGAELEHGAIAFFELQAGVHLALWPRPSISHGNGLPADTSRRHRIHYR